MVGLTKPEQDRDAVMPPVQRRSGTVGHVEASEHGAPVAVRRFSWQCWGITAFVFGAMALALLGRLVYSANAASKLGWSSVVTSKGGDYPDVLGPASRHTWKEGATAPSPTAAAGAADATPTASSTASSPPAASASGSTRPPPSAKAGASLFASSPLVPTSWRVVRSYPHDPSSFTQGLAWRGRNLIEGTGMNGHSKLRVQRLQGTASLPTVVNEVDLPGEHFGEGLCPWPPVEDEGALAERSDDAALADATVYQLTWKERALHVWGLGSFVSGGTPMADHWAATFRSTDDQGWGLTTDGTELIMSDGSEYLHWWQTGEVRRQQTVPVAGRTRVVDRVRSNLPSGLSVSRPGNVAYGSGVHRLNELEFVHGWVLANIWYDPRVAIIHPGTGAVVWYLDFTELLMQNSGAGQDCLNGLAYTTRLDVDASLPPPQGGEPRLATAQWGGRLWVTGKHWGTLYEVELGSLVPAEELGDWTGLPQGPQPWSGRRRVQAQGKGRK